MTTPTASWHSSRRITERSPPEYEKHFIDVPGGDELLAVLDRLAPHGDVLELACGPGTWTAPLLGCAARNRRAAQGTHDWAE